MNKTNKPTEIELARETLRRLALEKKPPTPDNYGEMYASVSGNPASAPFPEKELKKLHQQLPRETQAQINFARSVGSAIAKHSWDGLHNALHDALSVGNVEPQDWSPVIRSLLKQMQVRHVGLTMARKKEAVEHVLSASTSPDLLLSRLSALLRSWENATVEDANDLMAGNEMASPLPVSVPEKASSEMKMSRAQASVVEMRSTVAQLLEETIVLALRDSPDTVRDASDLVAAVRIARTAEEWDEIADRLKKFSYRAHFVVEDQAEIRNALMRVLQLIAENIGELIIDDAWLSGQVGIVRDLVMQPLNLRRIDEIERVLKDLIVKQSSLKKSLQEAKDRLTQMLVSFVDRLTDFSEATGDYHEKIGGFVEKIGKTKDISELTEVLDQVMLETRAIQVNTARSRDEMTLMRHRVHEAESEVARLRNELSHASELVRHDVLTGTLNRKGMDEALDREIAVQQRHGGHLSMALLDIDNFKRLNDTLGHAAGDEALKHLTHVVRSIIRPQDTLARYGGEEFVILLPDTSATEAVTVMTRIQRGLTREFFMHNNEKMLITFSCGVIEIQPGESPSESLKRADAAMYLAKRSGKNRVVPA